MDRLSQFGDKCFLVSNQLEKKMYGTEELAKAIGRKRKPTASRGWYSDCHFDPVAADYSGLKWTPVHRLW